MNFPGRGQQVKVPTSLCISCASQTFCSQQIPKKRLGSSREPHMTFSVSIQPILSKPETSPAKNCPWMKLCASESLCRGSEGLAEVPPCQAEGEVQGSGGLSTHIKLKEALRQDAWVTLSPCWLLHGLVASIFGHGVPQYQM